MTKEERENLEAQLVRMKAELDERVGSLPVHSIRPHQLIEIEELEDEISLIEKRLESAG